MSTRRDSKKAASSCSRRSFLQAAAASAAAISIVPRHVLGGEGQTPPSERIRLAGVGVGGVGFSQLQSCDKAGFSIAVLCDIDHDYAKKAFDKWPQARRYRDFREMLEAEADRIDAVYCGTPDHTHTIITLAALRKRKAVCCVKPLTRTIEECRSVVEEARKAKVPTQVTAAPNTSDAACRTCELIQAGAIGPVREVHIWSNRPVWPQGMQRPSGEDPLPAGFDWKMWLGPAPLRPFKANWPAGSPALTQVNIAGGGPSWYKSVYHPFNFRGWWDFGTGALGDMGCHHLNTPFRALRLAHPQRIHATATKVFAESAPLASIITYDFAARADMPPVRVVWYDGGLQPPLPRQLDSGRLPEEGVLYLGDEGTMLGSQVLDPARARKFADVPKTLERRGGTFIEWMQACKGGPKAGCDFDWAGLLTETVLLGNIAIRRGKRLEWDAAQMKFTNDAEANSYLRANYQNGWTL